jgi:hypothetical protein
VYFVSEEYLPSRVNALGYLRVRQAIALSQHPTMEAELASHKSRKIHHHHHHWLDSPWWALAFLTF